MLMRVHRAITVAMALVPLLVSGQAAGSIAGVVVDQSNARIPGAIVTVEGRMPIVVNADENGRFALHDVSPGRYRMRLERPGFRAKEMEIQVEDGKETSLGEVTLEVAPAPRCVGSMERL